MSANSSVYDISSFITITRQTDLILKNILTLADHFYDRFHLALAAAQDRLYLMQFKHFPGVIFSLITRGQEVFKPGKCMA